MENPLEEIDGVIKTLCQGSPTAQRHALDSYFLPDASFVHPFCAVPPLRPFTIPFPFLPGFLGGSSAPLATVGSRDALAAIYRWYRFMSPEIALQIDSKAYDERNHVLYVSIRQRFAIWFVPFYSADVRLVCELHLSQLRLPAPPQIVTNTTNNNNTKHGGGGGSAVLGSVAPTAAVAVGNSGNSAQRQPPMRYYIAKQEDHYQVNEFLRFVLPVLGPLAWFVWQQISTLFCILLALPIFFADHTIWSKEGFLVGK